MKYFNRQNNGFTLLELLVALAIFSVISVMAYGGLRTVINSKEATQHAAERLAEIQMVMLRISDDLRQAIPRKIRNEYGDTVNAMQFDHADSNSLEWSRAGYRNPAHLIRSNIQRVAYKLDNEKLLRVTWQVLDRAQDTQEMKTQVLSEVESLEWRFLDDKNEWLTTWPATDDKTGYFPFPKAVEVNFELKDWGKIKRLILLVDNV